MIVITFCTVVELHQHLRVLEGMSRETRIHKPSMKAAVSLADNDSVWCRYIQSTCATSGEGLYEGLDWLSSNIANKA